MRPYDSAVRKELYICGMCDSKGNESVFIGFCDDAKKEPGWNAGWITQQCGWCAQEGVFRDDCARKEWLG